MKRITRILVAVMLMAAMMVSTAFAAGGATINVKADPATAKAGDTITVTVSIDGNAGFKSYGMQLNYDKDAVTLVKMEAGALSTGGMFTGNVNADSAKVGTAAFAGSTEITADGTLFVATFKVKDGVEGKDLNFGATVDKIGGQATTVKGDKVTVPAKEQPTEPTTKPTEPTTQPTDPTTPSVDPTEPTTKPADETPKTGDDFNLGLFGAVALVAMMAAGGAVLVRRKN